MAGWWIVSFIPTDDHLSYSVSGFGFGAGVCDGSLADQFGGISESAGAFMRGWIDDVCVFHRDGSGIVSAIENRTRDLRDRRGRLDHADSIDRRLSGRGNVRGAVDEFDDAVIGSLDEANALRRTCEERIRF